MKELDIEMKVYCSISKNKFRKPLPTIRELFFPKTLNKKSFYCGDAVGRKNDFADTDYKFALNAKLNFYTPEHLFLGKDNDLPEIKYCFDINCSNEENENDEDCQFEFEPKNKEMVIMMGYPGSGKSFISKKIAKLYNYNIINQDILKTKIKCMKEATKLMKEGKSVIIDSTNPSKEKRKEWIDLAKENKFSVRIIEMTTSIEKSKHNNIYRSLETENFLGTKSFDLVPDIAYNMYKSKYEKPELSEGVSNIIKQNQNNPKDPLYFRYLM